MAQSFTQGDYGLEALQSKQQLGYNISIDGISAMEPDKKSSSFEDANQVQDGIVGRNTVDDALKNASQTTDTKDHDDSY